jgi:hypothetical protein
LVCTKRASHPSMHARESPARGDDAVNLHRHSPEAKTASAVGGRPWTTADILETERRAPGRAALCRPVPKSAARCTAPRAMDRH